MAENIKIFRGGGQNTDDSIELIAQNDSVENFNARFSGTSEGEEGLATNPESNVLIANTLPSGLNKAIGAAGFEVVRKAYSFIYNSQAYNLISKLDYDAGTQTNIFENLTDSGSNNVLPLNPEYYVNDIKLINDYILAWTDGNGQPYMINLTRLESGGYVTLTAEDFLIIKAQPMVVPTAEYKNDSTRSVNLLQGSLFQFTGQYIYLDSEYSAWSIISKREVPEKEDTPSVGTSATSNNTLIVSLNIGTDRVKELNVGARIGLLDFFLIRNITRAEILALPAAIDLPAEIREAYNPTTNIYSFCFYNDGLYTNIDPLETDLDYDHVPLKCETLENINGNMLALGGLTEGYARPVTDVLVQVVTYDPDIAIVPPDPALALRVGNWDQRRPPPKSYRDVIIPYSGIAKQGDKFKVVTAKLDGTIYNTMIQTVSGANDGNTEAAVLAFGAYVGSYGYPYTVYQAGTEWVLQFRTRPFSIGNREEALIVSVELALAGTPDSVSKATLKSNSSYQAFLWYKDKFGRYFPICTDSSYVVKTKSYSQLQGQASMLNWQIYHNPPADAAYYGWGLSFNNTHQTTLWTQGVLNVALSGSTYFTFNINPLKKFNEANPSSILNYEYSVGDRCTFLYYNIGADIATKTWLDKIDVEVVDFTIVTDTASPPNINYLLKVRKPSTITIVDLTANNIMLEIYTPKKRAEVVNGVTDYTEQVMYEIGLSYPITNGLHTVTSGDIKTGDVYIKSRQMANGFNLNQLDSLVVEDFNFSDFYASAFASYGKPRTYNDELGVIERKASIRYSETFQRGSLINGLTKFYPENIYGDGDGETSSNYGWIRKIRQRNNTLVVLQEIKVGYIPVFQAVVEDQQASTQYALSTKLFNYVRYNGKNIGMGNAKESYAEWNNNIYFVDPFRSEPIRAGLDGVDVISGKMSKYFKRVLQEAYEAGKKLIGYYDIFYNEYLLTTETEGDILVEFPFDVLYWQLDDTYVIPANGISLTAQGTKGVTTYNSATGIATYTPNTGQLGADNFTFSFTPSGGVPTTKKVCLTITAGDSCPNVISFADIINAEFSTIYASNPVLIIDINIPAAISITSPGEYRINGVGSWFTAAGTVVNNDSVEVRVTSSASSNTAVSTTLTVGCQSDTYTVTTKDNIPDPFVFVDVVGAEISTQYVSNTVTISGITTSVPISIVSGEYQIGSGAWTSASGTISNGQTVKVRRTSSGSYSTPVGTTLTVGTVSDTYTITTKVAPSVTVNYNMNKASTPAYVDIVIVPLVNTVNIGNIYATSTGVFAGIVAGDSVNIGLQHQLDYMPWPDLSSATLVIKQDGVIIYDSGTVTDPNLQVLGIFTFTALEGKVYDVIAQSLTTSSSNTPVSINFVNTSNVANSLLTYEFFDTTTLVRQLNQVIPSSPTNNVGMNWPVAGTFGQLKVTNASATEGVYVNVSNIAQGGTFNTDMTVLASGNNTMLNMPKTGYTITVTSPA